VFVDALHAAYLGGPTRAALVLPTVGLSELFAEPARHFIESHGGEVRCSVRVETVVSEGRKAKKIRTTTGEEIACRAAVLAVPPAGVESILPDVLKSEGFLQGMSTLPSSPIISIHLWYASEFVRPPMIGLVGKTVQWIFQRDGYVSAVISAARALVEASNEELANIAQRDIAGIFGPRVGKPMRTLVVKEKRATFSATPSVERLRPGARTPFRNLFLAGDWTATGYPATIEGAILSGETAARLSREEDCISREN
jgi:predicted NAD/FAD-dependent oxidoreductase